VWLADGAYITVLDDFRVWSKIPRFDTDGGNWKDFNIAPGDYPQKQPPIANAGPWLANFIDSTGYLTVTLPPPGMNAGTAVADGATISTYAWDIQDGTLIDGTLSSNRIIARFPPGRRYVKLTITDSNGKVSVNRCYIAALTRTAGPYAPITKFRHSRKVSARGQELTLNFFTTLSTTRYPDGALVLLFYEEHYGTQVKSLTGSIGREHMKFVGWHVTDPAELEATRLGLRKRMTWNCVDVAGRLELLPGFPQQIYRKATAANWQEMKGADINKYVHYPLYWHSTVLKSRRLRCSN
jgi:hypothetical protein